MEIANLPDELRPERFQALMDPEPTEWVRVWSSVRQGEYNGGISSLLVSPAQVAEILQGVSWGGHDLGSAASYRGTGEECQFDDGLTGYNDEEFFLQVLRHKGLRPPEVQFCYPFLWYFEAIPEVGRPEWAYFSAAGHRIPLVRGELDEGGHGYLEVSALPLRRFLTACERVLVVQHDWVQFSSVELPEPRMDASIDEDWCRSNFHAIDEQIGEHRSFSRMLGKHVVRPLDHDPCSEDDERRSGPYPEFVYAVDSETGRLLRFTCDEDRLSNNFHTIEGAPHYLTPVYFRRDVLTKYAQQPAIYQLEKRMLRCLDLWHLDMDINPEGLVEVFLGDLGTYLPPEEREHWLAANVAPSGGMNESRFRTDLLAQWVDVDDPVRALMEARARANEAAVSRWGRPIFRVLEGEDRVAWDGLHLMTTQDSHERDALVVVLAKGLVDGLDAQVMREETSDESPGSLNTLEALIGTWGADPDSTVAPLRLVQGFRSTGAAHLRGSNHQSLLARSGLRDLRPDEQFERLVRLAAKAVGSIAEAISSAEREPDGGNMETDPPSPA